MKDFNIRLKALMELKEKGIDPFPPTSNVTHSISKIKQDNKNEIIYKSRITTAGRVFSIRYHGKSAFVDIKDEGIKLQCLFRINELGDKYEFFKKYIKEGDIIEVSGKLFFTKVGELTLLVEDFRILCKALLSLPSIKYGIHDTEIRYRKRYLDLLINERTRETFILRSKIINEIRSFLNSKGFIEIETPILQPIYGGANAKPFKTHVNFLNEDWYLRISPELYLKRLVIGGINKVYEIGKVFRNEDIDVEHNPEFTMIEIYQSYVDYNDMMRLTEELISTVALKVLGKLEIEYGEYKINLALPWKRITMYDAIKMFSGFDVKKISDNEIINILEQYKIKIPGGYNRGLAIAKLFDIYCKDNLIQPTFIIDHPKETTPLCKLHRENKELIERFELYIAKMELANAYTELNDPVLQHQFFLEEMNRRTLGDEEAHQYDEDFIEAMCYGMPPIGGLGIGIDRLVMIFTGNTSIKEVIPFPMMKKSMSSFNFKDFLNCKK